MKKTNFNFLICLFAFSVVVRADLQELYRQAKEQSKNAANAGEKMRDVYAAEAMRILGAKEDK